MVKQLDDTDKLVLAYIGRYRVVTRAALAALLASQAAADKRVARLTKLGLLATSRCLPQKRALYQLSRKGVEAAGLSPARARKYGLQAIIKHLGLLLLCSDPEQHVERVEVDELRGMLGGELPDAAYCLVALKDRVLVAPAYVPGPYTPVRTVVRRVRRLSALLRTCPALNRLRPERRVGVLVVVDTETRRQALGRALRQTDSSGRPPVIKKTRVLVRCVPELARCLGVGPGAPAVGGAERGLWDQDEIRSPAASVIELSDATQAENASELPKRNEAEAGSRASPGVVPECDAALCYRCGTPVRSEFCDRCGARRCASCGDG